MVVMTIADYIGSLTMIFFKKICTMAKYYIVEHHR